MVENTPMNTQTLLKKPSAFVPVVMSLSALATVLFHLTLVGTAPQPDEGMAAHVWQLLMALQIPIIIFFVVKWLPRSPKQAITVLAFQAGAAAFSMALVFYLGW